MVIRLVNSVGCQIADFAVREGENLNRALKRAMSEDLWIFEAGDSIIFDDLDEE